MKAVKQSDITKGLKGRVINGRWIGRSKGLGKRAGDLIVEVTGKNPVIQVSFIAPPTQAFGDVIKAAFYLLTDHAEEISVSFLKVLNDYAGGSQEDILDARISAGDDMVRVQTLAGSLLVVTFS